MKTLGRLAVLGLLAAVALLPQRGEGSEVCWEQVDVSTVEGTVVDDRGVVALEEGESTLAFDEADMVAQITLPQRGDVHWAIMIGLPAEEGRVDALEPREGGARVEDLYAELCGCDRQWSDGYCDSELPERCVALWGAVDVTDVDDCAGDLCETAFRLRLIASAEDGRAFEVEATRAFANVEGPRLCSPASGCGSALYSGI